MNNPFKSINPSNPDDELVSLREKLAELETSLASRERQLNTAQELLRKKGDDYDSLFAQFPRGMQEEDYSQIKKHIDQLRHDGVADLQAYLVSNPETLKALVKTIKVTNVNMAILDFTEDETLQEYIEGEEDVDDWWDQEWVDYYAHEIACLAGPDMSYEDEKADTREDGSIFHVNTLVAIIRGYEDSWLRVITIFDDITERKNSEKALLEAKLLAEHSNQAKSDFLSHMSHELRTPLNAILGFTELVKSEVSLPQAHQSNLNKVSLAGQHLLTLIDEILNLSKIESGQTDVSLEPVKLVEIIDDSLGWMAEVVEKAGINIVFERSVFSEYSVQADITRLKQVLLNLLSNAIKYGRDQGTISIEFGGVSVDRIRVGIKDDGPGISSDLLKELFEPFKRLGAERSNIEGTGIGLAITRKLVELMQGSVSVETKVGHGCTFWLELLLVDERSIAMPLPQEAPVAVELSLVQDVDKPRILVAEDNLINQELLRAQLEVLGYEAEFVDNGVEALARWQAEKFGLLLTDINMPVLNGYDLIRQLRVLEGTNSWPIPIIVISANAMDDDVLRCFEIGANDVLAKPLGMDNLRHTLQKWTRAAAESELQAD